MKGIGLAFFGTITLEIPLYFRYLIKEPVHF